MQIEKLRNCIWRKVFLIIATDITIVVVFCFVFCFVFVLFLFSFFLLFLLLIFIIRKMQDVTKHVTLKEETFAGRNFRGSEKPRNIYISRE